jgi:ABC-2 type transport system permease protein
MTAYLNHLAFEFKTGLRNSTQLLMFYLFPLLFYAMMGLVMTEINPFFTESLIPAMVVFAALVGTLLGLPGPLVESREAGIFRSFKVNGVPAPSILLVPAITAVFHILIVSVIVALTGAPFFDGAAPTNWGAFALVTLVASVSFAGLGALIGVVAEGSRSTVLYAQAIFLPSMLLGGLMIPLSMLPESVQSVSLLLPATYAMEAFNGLAYGLDTLVDPNVALAALAASGLLAFGLAAYLFNWDSRSGARRGHPVMALLALLPYVAVTLISL